MKELDHYRALEKMISNSLKQMESYIGCKNVSDVSTFIRVGEYGLAWELLGFLIIKNNQKFPNELIEAGNLMGLNIENIKQRVRDIEAINKRGRNEPPLV